MGGGCGGDKGDGCGGKGGGTGGIWGGGMGGSIGGGICFLNPGSLELTRMIKLATFLQIPRAV